MCAQALAAFDISKCIKNDVEITPEVNIVGETIWHVFRFWLHVLISTIDSHQAPFKCSIRPRSAEAKALIEEESPYGERHGETFA